ncbi:hypothetical protein ACQVBX_03135 [Dyella sp. KULCS107]|uniref:hypothetical protein n=1 Tax=Dyella sp. KULCS107 TaxID=3422216 RepID=UPI003D6FD041
MTTGTGRGMSGAAVRMAKVNSGPLYVPAAVVAAASPRQKAVPYKRHLHLKYASFVPLS